MKPIYPLFLLLMAVSVISAEPKGDADSGGLAEAEKDVAAFKLTLKKKAPDQLVKEFIPAAQRRFGGYEYYYKYMANIAIREELEIRGKAAESALRENIANKLHIWEAINGPGDTVGHVCRKILSKLPK